MTKMYDGIREPSNAHRAAHVRLTMQEGGYITPTDDAHAAVCDLLADLRHFCHQCEDVEFDDAVMMSEIHFNTELDYERQEADESDQSPTG